MSRSQLTAITFVAMAISVAAVVFVQTNDTADTNWERQVADLAKNASNVSIKFNYGGAKSSIPSEHWKVIQAEFQQLASAEVVSESRGRSKSRASAETESSSSKNQRVSTIVIELDGKHVLINWNQNTINFNRTWSMSPELIRAVANCIVELDGKIGE